MFSERDRGLSSPVKPYPACSYRLGRRTRGATPRELAEAITDWTVSLLRRLWPAEADAWSATVESRGSAVTARRVTSHGRGRADTSSATRSKREV